jgi:hypothetical protein
MAAPTTRAEFKEYCLRRLGKPVIDINVSNEQIDDRIDDALQMYYDYHYDGAQKTYVAHQVTAADITNRYIVLDEDIIGITNIFDMGRTTSGSSLFNMRYQYSLNTIFDTTLYDLTTFYMGMQYLTLMEEILVGKTPIRFNRHTDKVYIDADWERIAAGTYIILEGYTKINPETWPDVWSDRWLQKYATELIKKQWGSNLSKYEGMQLPGGLTFNGKDLYQEAKEEITKLEEELIVSHSMPVSDMMG